VIRLEENASTLRALLYRKRDVSGYQDAIADPQGAVELLVEVRPEVDISIESPGVDLLAPLWKPDGPQGFGWQEEERWVDYADWLEDSGLLSSASDARSAFDNSFVANAGG